MRIFVTGATGFIGTPLVKELVEAGHQVLGLSRTDAGADRLKQAGAEPLRGTIEDLDTLRRAATGMDAVVNLAFNHDDWSQFAKNATDEQNAIQALGSALQPGKLLIVTSGTGLASGEADVLRTEDSPALVSPNLPRNPEKAAHAVAERGVHVGIVRLPQVHDTRKQGLVTMLAEIARTKGVSAYVGDGANRWAAAPLPDVAHLYHLAIQKTGPGVSMYHAVQEEGVPLRSIAEALARGFRIPATSLAPEQAAEHFGFFAHFVGLDMPASSRQTRKALDWNPTGPSLIEDLNNMDYSQQPR